MIGSIRFAAGRSGWSAKALRTSSLEVVSRSRIEN
jgi:hypothetical protein